MSEFRTPHAFENVAQAIQDAVDPEKPQTMGAAINLVNENARAVEDAINSVGTSSNGAAFGTEVTATEGDSPPFTEILDGGVWLVDAVVTGTWIGAAGTFSAQIKDIGGGVYSSLLVQDGAVDPVLFTPSYRYRSLGTSDDRLGVDALYLSGVPANATPAWAVTATYLGPIAPP